MDTIRKIELGVIILFVVINLILILNNPSISGYLLDENRVSAPSDFITKENILVEENKIIIEIEDYILSNYGSTGSMVPILDEYSNGVGIKPNSPDDLNVGDIITFRQDEMLIIHRIIEKGIDEEGVYFLTKGDNNFISDGKIRFQKIETRLVAIFY